MTPMALSCNLFLLGVELGNHNLSVATDLESGIMFCRFQTE